MSRARLLEMPIVTISSFVQNVPSTITQSASSRYATTCGSISPRPGE